MQAMSENLRNDIFQVCRHFSSVHRLHLPDHREGTRLHRDTGQSVRPHLAASDREE